MKKLISVMVAALMLVALIPAAVHAEEADEYVRSGDNGNVIVPYTTGTGITIDGTLAQGEWSETNKLSLDGKTTMKSWGLGEFEGHIDFYYSWGDKGLYMAAIVQDPDVADGAAQDETTLSTRFQIALNPAGIICDDYMGLFFSVCPVANSDIVTLTRHNYELSDNGLVMVEAGEEGYEGKYTFITEGEEVIGWNMECVIPWAFIATPDRYADLDETDEITLDHFNPKDENRKRAFCTATIAYVPCNTSTGGVCGTARTCTDGDPTIWTVDSYDLTLLFALADEINNRTTETEYFAPSEVVVTETETEAQTEKETEAQTEKETEAQTDAKTDAPQTDAQTAGTTDKAPETTGNTSTGGVNTGVIIGIVIAAVVAVAAIVAAIVLSKKKKK
jgi:hypothetical protein